MQVVLGKDLVPLAVNPVSLRVQHIIVFQQMLAHIKVSAFHAGLRLLNQPVHQRNFDWHVLIDLEAL